MKAIYFSLLVLFVLHPSFCVFDIGYSENYPKLATIDPLDDILLSDLQGEYFFNFPLFRGFIHQKVVNKSNVPSKFAAFTPTQRILLLLPTKATMSSDEIWVPFLVDTGSPEIYLTMETIQALKITLVYTNSHIYIHDVEISFYRSTNHFHDINILGASLLSQSIFFANYVENSVSFMLNDFAINYPPSETNARMSLGITTLENEKKVNKKYL